MSSPHAPPGVPSGAPVNFEALLHKLDGDFGALPPSFVEQFRFELDGLSFDVRRIKQKEGHRFLVTAKIGYLPFSVESSERREIIKTIVLASRTLPTVHFSIDPSSKITAGALLDVRGDGIAPDFIFYPLMLFLQEAQPFIQLIGRYLLASPAIAA
jgi:hypothetical protein